MTGPEAQHELDLLVRLASGEVVRLGQLGPETLLAVVLDDQTPWAREVLRAILEGYHAAQR